MWGSDWTKLSVGGLRWYLLTMIDFFSRLIVAFEVVPSVHVGHVKAIYQAGLKGQGQSADDETKPELRVDRSSPNTSGITREFFEALGAELSFARVRRPTDNALTKRFYGTVKQEEIFGGELSRRAIGARRVRPVYGVLQSAPAAPGAI